MSETFETLVRWLDLQGFTSATLIFLLFFIPRILNRFGLPIAVGAFSIGLLLSKQADYFESSQVVPTFALLGIVSLFVFAGLEVQIDELRARSKMLISHLIVRVALILGSAFIAIKLLDVDFPVAALIALAVLTPSAGFILDSLNSLEMASENKEWVKITAIASELVALVTLVLVQASSLLAGLLSIVAIALTAVILPAVFRVFATGASKVSDGADFTFLLLLAVLLGSITKKMGAYYLVGAFIVGISLRLFERSEKSGSSKELMSAIRYFSAFFMPFYFFHAGTKTGLEQFNAKSLILGLGLFLAAAPCRIAITYIHRKILLKEDSKAALTISTSLLPTLVFGLVLIELLQSSFGLDSTWVATLTAYTLFTTTIPPLILRYKLKARSFAEFAESDSPLEFPPETRLQQAKDTE